MKAKQVKDVSQRQAALIAGYGLLFMFISGLFASNADSAGLLDTIIAAPWKFRMNIAGDVMMLVFDVVAALGLYAFLKPVNRSISLLAAWFRLVHVAIYGAALILLFYVLDIVNGVESAALLDSDPVKDQMMYLLKGHEYGFRIGLVFFGFHFLILGYLVLKSVYVPNIIGAFLVIVSIAYLTNSFASVFLPNYDDFKNVIQWISFVPAIIAELTLCVWLIWAGGKDL